MTNSEQKITTLRGLAAFNGVAVVIVILLYCVNTFTTLGQQEQVQKNTENVSEAKSAIGPAKDEIKREVAKQKRIALAEIEKAKRKLARKNARTNRRVTRLKTIVQPIQTIVRGEGLDGRPGRAGEQGATGAAGVAGEAGIGCPSTNVLCRGPKGEDGKDSTVPGPPGPGPTDAQVQAAVAAYCAAHNNCTPVVPPPDPMP